MQTNLCGLSHGNGLPGSKLLGEAVSGYVIPSLKFILL